MKEILAFIRINKINDTKKALADGGYFPMTCRKVYGRGKQKVDYELIEELVERDETVPPSVKETISENHRLVAKRYLGIVVDDGDVAPVVKILIEANQTGSMGDGKIFVTPIDEAVRIRTGERGIEAL
ncbi:P-II family nitrogen regulator [Anaerotalea alkaliphila]|uniref:P-II family nitrogen regulator n=1 Tax=Anaerotalea alkaliphila TaxID=2662126 RepID=A0A7X5KL62_9FIRM|nr:P-II family nitrogen regulator [Anaerotalea alkaliphila]NDL66496.1 P-II family nitrogen regulator [Anaerotalea alkaliphila]